MDKEWYIYQDDHHKGPFGPEEIMRSLETGEISRDSFLWKEGLGEWRSIDEVQDLLKMEKRTLSKEMEELFLDLPSHPGLREYAFSKDDAPTQLRSATDQFESLIPNHQTNPNLEIIDIDRENPRVGLDPEYGKFEASTGKQDDIPLVPDNIIELAPEFPDPEKEAISKKSRIIQESQEEVEEALALRNEVDKLRVEIEQLKSAARNFSEESKKAESELPPDLPPLPPQEDPILEVQAEPVEVQDVDVDISEKEEAVNRQVSLAAKEFELEDIVDELVTHAKFGSTSNPEEEKEVSTKAEAIDDALEFFKKRDDARATSEDGSIFEEIMAKAPDATDSKNFTTNVELDNFKLQKEKILKAEKEKRSGRITRLFLAIIQPKVMASLGMIFLLSVGLYFVDKYYLSFPKRPNGMLKEDYRKLARAAKVDPTKQSTVEFASSFNGKKIWMVSNFDADVHVKIRLEAIKDRVLSDKPAVLTAEGKLKNKMASFTRFNLVEGKDRPVGWYHVVINSVKPIKSQHLFERIVRMFRGGKDVAHKKLNADKIIFWGKKDVTENKFQKLLMEFNKHKRRNSINHLEEINQSYFTLIELTNQLEHMYGEFLDVAKVGNDFLKIEKPYNMRLGVILGEMVKQNSKIMAELKYNKSDLAQFYQEHINFSKRYGKIFASMFSEISQRGRLSRRSKRTLKQKYNGQLDQLRSDLGKKRAKLSSKLMQAKGRKI